MELRACVRTCVCVCRVGWMLCKTGEKKNTYYLFKVCPKHAFLVAVAGIKSVVMK